MLIKSVAINDRPPSVVAASVTHEELEGIQYVRAAAALMVVFDHASVMMAIPKYFSVHPLSGFFESGAVGVDLFFCLSGFIIVYIAMSSVLTPKLSPQLFFMRRFARIIPFMWIVIIMYAILRILGRGYFPYWNYIRAFILFPVGEIEPSQIWTLRYEMLFYAMFAISFLSGRKWILLLWVASPCFILIFAPTHIIDSSFLTELIYYLCSGVNIFFGLGVITGIFYVTHKTRWPMSNTAIPYLIISIAAIFAATSIRSFGNGGIQHVQDLDDILHVRDIGAIIFTVLIGLMSCLCIAIACCMKPSKGLIGGFFRTLGDASYSIYMTHSLFISALLGIAASHFRMLPSPVVMAVSIVISVGCGVAVNRYIEIPIVSFSKRMFLPRK